MARYFKIIEIDRDSFVEAIGEDLDCRQLVVPSGEEVYVAVDDENGGKGRWQTEHTRLTKLR